MAYVVHYTNKGKKERTPAWATRKEAEESADFLRFQGAKKVSIRLVSKRRR